MQHERQPLDYRSGRSIERVRPERWLSHTLTAALLCVVALLVDRQLRYDSWEARRVAHTEVALAIYGVTCAIVCLTRGALTSSDRVAVAGGMLLFVFTAYVGLLMPRVIYN